MRREILAGVGYLGLVLVFDASTSHAGSKVSVDGAVFVAAPAPLLIKCPCLVTIPDGSISVSPGSQLQLIGTQLSIQQGHWSSDSPAVLENPGTVDGKKGGR